MTTPYQPEAPKPLKTIPPHHEWDACYIELLECDWDELGYIEYRKKDDFAGANRLLDDWLSSHVGMRIDEWNMRNPEEKRKIIFDWVESHQPEDWKNQTDPPLAENFIGRDERIPFTFMSDLHVSVAEELATLINERNAKDYGRPLNEDEVINAEDHIIPYLEVFTSLSTPADTLYGSDFYFRYKYTDAKGEVKEIKYYIDITKDEETKKKKLEYRFDKADYVLAFDLVDKEGRKRKMTLDDVNEKGKEIAIGVFGKLYAEMDSLMAKR